MNIAVKVNSSEEFKKVTKYARKNGEYDSFNIYKDESCVSLDDGCHQTESWYRSHEFTIISYSTFEEKYLKLSTPELIKMENLAGFNKFDEIRFKTSKVNVPDYVTDPSIPKELVKHGSTVFQENKGVVVDFHDKYIIVSYIDTNGRTVQLGFLPDKLEKILTAVKPESVDYVECTNKYDNFTIGKIYNFPNPIDDNGHDRQVINRWESPWTSYFKPSTKEAYEKQNASKSPEFVVGKWYKGWKDKNYRFAKFHHKSNNQYGEYFYWTEAIHEIWKDKYDKDPKATCNWGVEQGLVLADLSEIQSYLPEGHVDKIKKNITPIKGQYYVSKKSGNICRWGDGDSEYFFGGRVDEPNVDFRKGTGAFEKNELREATLEEKQWLEASIKANKFIPKEQISKSPDMGLKITDLQKDQYYKASYKEGYYCLVKISETGTVRGSGIIIYTDERKGESSLMLYNYFSSAIHWEKVTLEEEKWLIFCLEGKKYFSKEEALSPKKEEKPIEEPQKGDWIKIVKSNKNWHSDMDKWANKVVQITSINYGGVRFKDDGGWSWKKSDNHFVKAELHEIPKEEKEFVLPDKWCIKITDENRKALSLWRDDGSLSESNYGYIYYKGYYQQKKGYCEPSNHINAPEITFEQFQKYVLGNTPIIATKEQPSSEEIQNRFPVGTVFIDLVNGVKCTVNGTSITRYPENNTIYISAYSPDGKNVSYRIYEKGVWANIVKLESKSNPMKQYRISELKYPMVIHTPTKGDYDRMTKAGVKLKGWEEGFIYYLIGNIGFSKERASYEHSGYIILEMCDIIFPIEENKPESLLEEAKRRYPVGTVINSLGGSTCMPIGEKEPYFIDDKKNGIRFHADALVYLDGKWAEIVTPIEFKGGSYITGIDPYKIEEEILYSPKKVTKVKGFDEKEYISNPYNQLLAVKIKKQINKPIKLNY